MIQIVDLEKNYGDRKALKKLNFTFSRGGVNCIVGRNGAGKSTLLKCILGSIDYDSGKVLISSKISAKNTSYLAEERGLYKNCTVFDQIKYFADISKIKNSKEKTEEVILDFELGKYTFTKIKKLSKGNAQKVQLACVFVSSPQLLILDEPFSGLDIINQKKVAKIIKKYSNDKTVLVSTHQTDFLDDFCDNILVIKDGFNVLSGNVEDIKKTCGKKIEIVFENDTKKTYNYVNNIQLIELIKRTEKYKSICVSAPKLTTLIKNKLGDTNEDF